MDPTKVYFSPRLSQEHWRIAQQVKEGEVVVDMFTGIGPFAIQIAKNHEKVKIYAIDLNPDAIEYLKKNIYVNKVERKVIPLLGDVRKVIEDHLTGVADRVIMNLPENAIKFISVACKSLKKNGGILHYHSFETEPNVLEKAAHKLKDPVESSGRVIGKVLNSHLVKAVAPYEWHVVLDVLIH